MEEIKVKLVGSKNVTITEGNTSIIRINKESLFFRSNYRYEKWKDNEDKSMGVEQHSVREYSYISKKSIYQVSLAWDDDEECWFVLICSGNDKLSFIVGDDKTGIELVEKITSWLFSL